MRAADQAGAARRLLRPRCSLSGSIGSSVSEQFDELSRELEQLETTFFLELKGSVRAT